MSRSVLIVEDEKVLQEAYGLILAANGYEVRTADNGLEGLRQLKSSPPHLVLLDLFMPVLDGKEFLRNIDPADYPQTKIVVYTNLSDKETEQEMLGLGAHKFVLKSGMAPQDLVELAKSMTSR